MRITEISIKRTTIPVVVFTILILGGLFAYSRLSMELTPNMNLPYNAVITEYPGAAPSEVENSVTRPIEEAVSSMEQIKKINSSSYEGFSLIIIEFQDGVDPDISLQNCERKVNNIRNDLPANSKEPQFLKFDVNMFPMMNIAVNSDIPEKQFYDLVEKEIKPRFSQVKGVAQVDIIGGNKREIQIKCNEEKLAGYGVSLVQIKQILAASDIDFPVGKVKTDDNRMIIRISGKFTNLKTIENLVIKVNNDGSAISLRDVASVVDGIRQSKKLARISGQPAIGIAIQKQSGANAVDISDQIRKEIVKFEKDYRQQNLKFTIANDSSGFTRDAVDSVMSDLIFAIILVSLTMLLFLHNFRNLIFIVISIPTSLISAFIVFPIFGLSLNLLTLLALSIVVGTIVDDAIVVLENIYRHMEMGKSRWEASLDATRELGVTVFSITIVLVAVFLPIGLTSGVTGQLLRSFSFVIVFSILISLLVSFTLVPLLTAHFARITPLNKQRFFDRIMLAFEKGVNWSRERMLEALSWSLQHKAFVIITVVILFLGSFLLVSQGFIQAEFMNEGDRGEFTLSMELKRTATLQETRNACKAVEKDILSHHNVRLVYTQVGKSSGSISFDTPYSAEFLVEMIPKTERKLTAKLFAKQLKRDLSSKFAGLKFKVQDVTIIGTYEDPIELYVRGSNYAKVKQYSEVVLNVLKNIMGTSEIRSSDEKGNKEYVVHFNRDKLAKLGLTIGDVGTNMFIAFEGDHDLKYRDGDNEYDINLSLDDFDKRNKSDIENISFVNQVGQLIKLKQVADIVGKESPTQLDRFNKLPSITIKGQLIGKTIGTVGDELKARLTKLKKPKGVSIYYAGDMEQQSNSFDSLFIAFLASLIFMYLIMVALYDSYVYPFVVMLSLPLSVIGALLAMAMARESLSIFSFMGIIMLMGLVAKNAILVVDFANDLRNKGIDAFKAVVKATSLRFRPIIMTNLTLIIGMLPIALANGPGAEWKNSLGWALIGGLTSSMFLSMLVVPVLFVIFDKLVKRKNTPAEI